MKKSPLSTPSGSKGVQNYNRKSHENKNMTGYGYQCISPNRSQTRYGDDFIPLTISTPVPEQQRHSGNWYGSGGNRNHRSLGSGGFNHYRNNYQTTPKSNFNNSYSPYKHYGKQYYGQKKGYCKDAHRYVDISRYIDMKSFLEDPWAELMRKLNESKEVNKEKSPKNSQSIHIDSESDSERKSATDFDDLQFSQQSRNESSVDVTLGLDDTDIGEVSRADSSIDLKIDDINFSQDSKNESLCSTNEAASKDTSKEDNIRDSRDSEIGKVQESI